MTMTISSTKMLAVNPAFLQEIKDSNPEVWDTVHRLGELCQQHDDAAQLSRQLTRLLDDLRDQLALQFSLEETYGYLEIPGHSFEVLGEMAAQARSQHGILYLRLNDLAEQAEELQYRGVEVTQLHRLIDRAADFHHELREHERMENDLIQRSYNLA